MYFCIPLLPKSKALEWDVVRQLLLQTLGSLKNQTRQDFEVVIACHEKPDIEPGNLKISYLIADWDPAELGDSPYRDKNLKKALLGRFLRSRKGGYAMFLDADDLIHRDLVHHVYENGNPNGYIIESGYALDYSNRRIAEIPGFWPKTYDFYCGSCAIFNFGPADFLSTEDQMSLYRKLRSHVEWRSVMEAEGRPLQPIPFAAGVYVLNHSDNNHSRVNVNRARAIPRLIESHQIALSDDIRTAFAIVV